MGGGKDAKSILLRDATEPSAAIMKKDLCLPAFNRKLGVNKKNLCCPERQLPALSLLLYRRFILKFKAKMVFKLNLT